MNQKQTNQIYTIQSAIENNLISPYDAIILVKSSGVLSDLEKDPLVWGKFFFPDKFTLPFCYELHSYFVEIKDYPLTDTLAPRGYAKTTIKCFLLPIYMALTSPDRYRHYLNIQATSSKAVAVNIAIKEEIENNELIRLFYGNQIGDKWTEKQFVLRNGVVFTAVGAGDSVRGIQYKNTRPDYCVIDDLYDDDDAYNPMRIEKKNSWFWSSIYKAMAKTTKDKKVCIHIQGTAIHTKDLMHELSQRDKWVFKKFQAIKSEDKKIVLWPEAETYEKLMEDKIQMGSYTFNREMMNDVNDDENATIKRQWIKRYRHIPPKFTRTCISVDAAFKDEKSSDYVVLQAWGVYEENFYLIDQIRGKLSFTNTVSELTIFMNFYDYISAKLIEEKANGAAIIDVLKDKVSGIIPINPKSSKNARLESVSPLFEAGNVYIPHSEDCPWVDDFIEEVVSFPFSNHDDQVDAMTQALTYLRSKKITKIVL